MRTVIDRSDGGRLSRIAARPVLMICLLLLFVLAPLRAPAATDDPKTLLPEHDPALIDSTDKARAALAEVDKQRQRMQASWRRREYDCYQKILVNGCLADLGSDRRGIERRFKSIEVKARQVIREESAHTKSQTDAQVQADRAAGQPDRDRARTDQLEQDQRRRADHEDKRRQREADDARRASEAPATASKLHEREQALKEKNAKVEERRAAAAANVAEYERRIKEHEDRVREREQRDRAKAEQPATKTPPPALAPPPAAPPR